VYKAFENEAGFENEFVITEYGYSELYIPPNPDGSFKIDGNTWHQWITTKDVMIWGFPNPEGDFNILISMKLYGPKPSFEYF